MELPLSYTLFTPVAATSPKVCRDFVRSTLETLGLAELAETAALCTSELVTNVNRYAEGDVHLRAAIESTHVRVAVYDGSTRLPSPRRATAGDDGGRGLFLVTALSDVCGVTPIEGGKECGFSSIGEGAEARLRGVGECVGVRMWSALYGRPWEGGASSTAPRTAARPSRLRRDSGTQAERSTMGRA
jgi:anti-sigma regulatory factor (Ser/Thr protein kinase)